MSNPSPISLSESVAKFIRDLLKMCDLQFQLLSVDFRAVAQSGRAGTILMLISTAIMIGSLPVFMFGIAGVLHLVAHIPVEYAWLLVGSVMFLAGVVVLRLAVAQVMKSLQAMQRSHEEFRRNVEWIRSVLHQQ